MPEFERRPTRGVILQPVDEPARFTEMVNEIESLGYANLWCTDSSLHARSAYAYLTMAALSTTRLRIGTAVTNPLSRHPAVTAVAAATVDEISSGRFILGIGAGDRPLLALGLTPSRLGKLERAVEDIRRLWSGETVDDDGPEFSLHEAHLRIPARSDLPVYLSASGPKTLALAGRVADGVLILTGLFGAAAKWAVSCVRRGADAAGRVGPDRPHIAVCAYGAIDDERPDDALAAASTIATWFPQTAPVVCELAGLDPAVVQRVREAYQGGEFQEAAAVTRLLPDQFRRAGCPGRWAGIGGAPDQNCHRRRCRFSGAVSPRPAAHGDGARLRRRLGRRPRRHPLNLERSRVLAIYFIFGPV